MAAREGQGMQIALIVFVMLTVALGVTTFLYFRKAEENVVARRAADEAKKKEEAFRGEVQLDNQRLKEMLGYAIDEKMETINANFDKDMQILPDSIPKNERNYRMMPQEMFAAVSKMHQLMTEAVDEQKKYIAEKNTIADDRDKQLADAKQTVQATQDKAAKDHADFESERARITGEMTKVASQLTEKDKAFAAAQATSNQQLGTLKSQVGDLQKTVEIKNDELKKLNSEEFQSPAGYVTHVNQAANLVYINLGTEDFLPRQATFSVFEQGQQDFSPENIKATIEVTKIVDPHLSEARIVTNAPGNPIIKGDIIYTPTWQPGTQVHFALAGMMDLDQDGQTDVETVRNLITMNGGVVDYYEKEGRRLGKGMDFGTRYLVLGERPGESASKETLESFSAMINQASNLGLEVIPLSKLLSQMGYRGGARVVTLGRGADAEDFKAKPAEGVNPQSTGNTSEVFQQRQPPARGRAGAF